MQDYNCTVNACLLVNEANQFTVILKVSMQVMEPIKINDNIPNGPLATLLEAVERACSQVLNLFYIDPSV